MLLTTYTNALIRFSEQLLEQLVGKDIGHVRVQTADSVAMTVVFPTPIIPMSRTRFTEL